jgi:hypothetical protein
VPNQAILYLSHVVNKTLWRSYKRLRSDCANFADVYFLLNLSSESIPANANAKGAFPVTPAQRAKLGHPSRAGKVGWWMDASPSHTQIVQSGFDQALLVFRQMKPEYDFYWLVEFDVEFSGNWSELIKSFADNKSDLLCSSIHRQETNPHWGWWQSLLWPHGPKPELIRGFFPFARLSARALDTIIEAGQAGVDGFQEVLWPTVLHNHGMIIEDIGGDGPFVRPGNINRWYTSTPANDTLSPGTLVARPIRMRPGRNPNKLWHPVKRRFIRHVIRRLLFRISTSLPAK